MDPFMYINAAQFFAKYAPQVKRYKHKMRGMDGHGKSLDFTDDDKTIMEAGLKKMCADLIAMGFRSPRPT